MAVRHLNIHDDSSTVSTKQKTEYRWAKVANKKIYIIAGEPSGDLLGAKILRALREDDVTVSGVGGPLLQNEGLVSLFDIREISHGGIVELIPHIPRIKQLIKMTVEDIVKARPDVLLTIDSPGFSFRIAKIIKKRNLGIRTVHFVAPSVWAWRPKRAQKIAKIYDVLLALFDFEPQYFLKYGLRTEFVGHPLVEDFEECEDFPKSDTLLLMPGSRLQEIKQMLPIFLAFADDFHHAGRVVIPTLPHLRSIIEGMVESRGIEIITDEKIKNEMYRKAGLAVVASGTATLQLALARCPMIVCYKMNGITYNIIKPLVKTEYIALCNIVLNAKIVPELIQKECTAENIMRHASNLDKEFQISRFKELRDRLYNDGVSPSKRISEIIIGVR
ncbi:MAG: lipid-A-disaccharide synthase [Holosporales bacterium]|jgi:lipid-A-disaccharide synthase|nr:lipid-A-disaccharide synthase [Holosporales bacterium]